MHWAQALAFCGCLMGASIYDVRHRLVDDRVCVALVLAGLITISPASLREHCWQCSRSISAQALD